MKPKLSLPQLLKFTKTCGSNVPAVIMFLILFALSSAPSALSQVPRGFNYQAIVRDASKHPVVSQPIKVRITIETALPASVYREEHTTSTDEFGIMAIVIGEGTPTGTDLFDDIDWNKEALFIRTELQYPVGGSYTLMGTAPLLSVPYAMVADSLSTPITKLVVKGETTSYEEPLFEVKNKDGNTVFAVYNEGVRVYVGDGAVKGPKGGFSIGGFGSQKDENAEKYLWVDDDSVRVYINDAGKSAKGGFAIGGFGTVKGLEWPRYLRVSSDSTRVMTTDPDQGFGVKSGTTGSYLRLTPENYFIGHGAGRSIGIGKFNSFIGYEAGKLTTSGKENIFIGYQSGLNNIGGKWNTFLGYQAGMTNSGSDNTFIGYMAGSTHQSKGGNVFIGSKAGELEQNGEQNILVGESTGTNITTGSYNIMMGFQTGFNTSEGLSNVFIGQSAGFTNTLGSYNVFLGFKAGYKNIGTGEFGYPGNYNVFIGYASGSNNTEGQSNVFLGNNSGLNNTKGRYNTYLGRSAGSQIKEGNFNVFIGAQAAEGKKRGNNNVYIGNGAGGENEKGSGNVFIGFSAGYNEQDSALLIIENSNSAVPLIGGDFDADKVAINGKPNPAGATLQVNGSMNGSLRVGDFGSNISLILRANVNKDVASVPANGYTTETFTVANAPTTASVMISPQSGLADGLLIAYARVVSTGVVEIKLVNTTASPINPDLMNWYITVIQ